MAAATGTLPGPRTSGAVPTGAHVSVLRRSPWLRFLLRRTGRLAGSLVVLVVAAFALIHLVPGDPVRGSLGLTAPPELVHARRVALGLDKPLLSQFWTYVTGLAHGDLGQSMSNGLPVSRLIADRLPNTAALAALAFLLVMLVALPVGMALAVATQDGRRRGLELGFIATSNTITAIPNFLLAVGGVALFAVALKALPVAGKGGASSYVLPVLALAAGPAASLALIVRVETLRVLRQDYMRTGRAKRLPARLLYLRHALPNLLTAALTLGGLLLGGLVAGTVLVENVFAWPGLGTTIVGSINEKDYPVVQSVVLVLGAIVLVINLLVDLAVATVDPRSTILES